MDVTIFLAKVLGMYMLLGGIAVIVRKRFVMSAVASLVEEKGARLILSVFDILLGLIIVNLHNDWSTITTSIISLIGWVAIVKGLTGVFLKDSTLEKFVQWFRAKNLYMYDGAVAIVLGLYLANAGFGWF